MATSRAGGVPILDPFGGPVRPSHPDVEQPDEDAVPDPNWERMRTAGPLPSYYLPPTMPGQLSGWRRAAAWTVVVMLLSSASAGICLTYGPEELWRLLGVGG